MPGCLRVCPAPWPKNAPRPPKTGSQNTGCSVLSPKTPQALRGGGCKTQGASICPVKEGGAKTTRRRNHGTARSGWDPRQFGSTQTHPRSVQTRRENPPSGSMCRLETTGDLPLSSTPPRSWLRPKPTVLFSRPRRNSTRHTAGTSQRLTRFRPTLCCGDVEENPGPLKRNCLLCPWPPTLQPVDRDDFMLRADFFLHLPTALHAPAPFLDAFAAPGNSQLPLFWCKHANALSFSWFHPDPLWMNPPFSRLRDIAHHLLTKPCHVILLWPAWGPRFKDLTVIARARVQLPLGVPLFLKGGVDLMPPPRWVVHCLYINQESPLPEHTQPPLRHLLRCGDVEPNPGPPLLPWAGAFPFLLCSCCGILHTLSRTYSSRLRLLQCGDVEENPGPFEGPSSFGWDEVTRALATYPGRDQWDVTMVSFASAPSSPSVPRTHHAFNLVCLVCQTELCTPTWQQVLTHLCPPDAFEASPDHSATGRGDFLASCGDVEQNPGPPFGTTPVYASEVFPSQVNCPLGRGASLLSCGDVEANPGPEDPLLPAPTSSSQPMQEDGPAGAPPAPTFAAPLQGPSIDPPLLGITPWLPELFYR